MRDQEILIVDDSEAYLQALERALRDEWTSVCAGSLDQAVRLLSGHRFAAAIVDVRLSESDPENRDGIRLLRLLRESQPALPVILMSAYRDFDAISQAVNLHANHFLTKPVDVRELKQMLNELTGGGPRSGSVVAPP
jgi:DNA-binding NtrC family response regulator